MEDMAIYKVKKVKTESSRQEVEEEMYRIIAANVQLEKEIERAREVGELLQKNRARLAELSKKYAEMEG